jgi:hypothetical protein
VTDFFEFRQSLKEEILIQPSKPKKIRVCIIYAIEDEKITEYKEIKEFTINASNDLGLYSKTNNPRKNFDGDWGIAVRQLIEDERVREISVHKLKSASPPIKDEITRIAKLLRQIDDPLKVYSGLSCLWRLSRTYDVTSFENIRNALSNILASEQLLGNYDIFFELIRVLAEAFTYYRNYPSNNTSDNSRYLCENHLKALCSYLSRRNNIKEIIKASNHLFLLAPCEHVISTLFGFVEELGDDDYLSAKDSIQYALFDADSVLFDELHASIDKELQALFTKSSVEVKARVHDLNVAFTRRYARINQLGRGNNT